jgi:hypothetical protein
MGGALSCTAPTRTATSSRAPRSPTPLCSAHLLALASLTVGADLGTVIESGRGTYLVRGAAVTDTEALKVIRTRGLPDHETVVEIAARVLAPTTGGA